MKMLAWPNGKRRCGFRVYIGLIHMQETKRRRKAPLRRRNRAREDSTLYRDLAADPDLTTPWCAPSASNYDIWDDEREDEDAEGLRFVDFNGVYRTETT